MGLDERGPRVQRDLLFARGSRVGEVGTRPKILSSYRFYIGDSQWQTQFAFVAFFSFRSEKNLRVNGASRRQLFPESGAAEDEVRDT